MKRILVALLWLAALAISATAQIGPGPSIAVQTVSSCGALSLSPGIPTYLLYQSTGGDLCTTGGGGGGTVAGGWLTATVGSPLTVTTSSTSGTVTGSSSITEVLLTNVGTAGAYCGVTATATASYQYISPSGGWFPFQIGSGSNTIACITATGSTTVNVQTGSGLATGTGGGSGGGTSGAVTAVAGAFAAGWSPDIGNATTASPWSGTGTPSEISLLWGIYNSASSSYNYQQAPIATTVTSSGSYTAGYAVGGLQTVTIFRTTSQPTAMLTQFSISMVSAGIPSAGPPTYEVFIFNKNPTSSTCTDAGTPAQFVLNAADAPYLISGSPFNITPVVPTAGTTDAFGSAPSGVMPLSIENMDGTATQDIYICLVASAAITNPANTTGPIINIGAIRDFFWILIVPVRRRKPNRHQRKRELAA